MAEGELQKQLIRDDDTRYKKVDNVYYSPDLDKESIRKAASSFMCGCRISRKQDHTQIQQLQIMVTIATAMRAANVADFYMTKYQSKAQEMLGPVIQPFIAGMRRIAQAESEPAAAEDKTITLARRRIRKFIFSANHTTWYSACELAVFLRTGSTCVKSEPTTKIFSGKGFAMMHECKRQLNHATAAEGLLVAQMSSRSDKATALDTFMVPASESSTDSDSSHSNENCHSKSASRHRSSEMSLQQSEF